uniref:non-specific serine/threonine protein kinase n=1 Tax=Panagrellus redivivus TaxID=6233 RepID=A0A7E4VXJ7_PANRE
MSNVYRILDLLHQVCDSDTKKGKRYELIEQVFLHFNDDETRKELTSGDDWLDAVQLVANVMVQEFDETGHCMDKGKRTTTAAKIRGFELFNAFIMEQCNGGHDGVQFADFIVPLTSCFSKVFEVRTLLKDAWAMTIELVLAVFKQYTIVDLDYLQFKNFWNELTRATRASLSDTTTFSRNDRRTLLSIMTEITPTLASNHCFSTMPTIINQICDLAKLFSWDARDNARTPFLEILNHLIVTTADRYRGLLLERIYPTVYEHVLPHLRIIAPNESRNFRAYTSPVKSKTQSQTVNLSEELPEKGFSAQVYKLVTHIIILAYPDCELNSTNFTKALDIVDSIIRDRIDTEIAEKDNKLGVTKTRFVLPSQKIPLLARTALLGHLQTRVNGDSQEPVAKRAKTTDIGPDFLVDLIRSRLYPRWQIVLMIVTNWKHRLTDTDLDAIADALIAVEQAGLKKDESLELLLQICAAVFSEKRNIDLQKYSALWKSAVSLIPGTLTRDSACNLVAAMAPYVTSILSIKPNDILSVVFFQIAQLTTYSSSVIHLIHVIITSFDFDEHVTLRADLVQSVHPEWKFRLQLLYSILSYADPHCTHVWNLLQSLLSYNPADFPVELLSSTSISTIPDCERHLTIQFCKQPASETSSNAKTSTPVKIPKNECIAALIMHLVDYLNQHFDFAIEDRSRRIFLWKTCIYAVADYGNDELKRLLEAFESSLAEDFALACSDGQTVEVAEALSTMQIGCHWQYSGAHLKHAIKTLDDEFEDIGAHKLAFFWEACPIAKWILEDRTVAKSTFFDPTIRQCVDDFTFYDLLLLMATFSSDLQPELVSLIIDRALIEIRSTAVTIPNADAIQAMTEQLVYTVLRYIDLNTIKLSDDFKAALRNCETVFAHAVHALPLKQLTSDDITVIAEPLDALQTCRLLEAYLRDYESLVIPIGVLKAMLKHDASIFVEFVPHFEEYLDYWGPSLIFVAAIEKSYHSSWKRKWIKFNKHPLVTLLLRGDAPSDAAVSPDFFFVHPALFATFMNKHADIVKGLFEQPYTVKMVMCALRKAIYKLRQSRSYLRFNYPYYVLNVVVSILKIPSLLTNLNHVAPGITGDIAALVTALVSDAVEMMSEALLAPLLIEFYKVLPDSGLEVLKVLVIADLLVKSGKFDSTVAKLADFDMPESRGYWHHARDGYSAKTVPAFVKDDVARFLQSNYFELDEFGSQLTAFWLELRRQLLNNEKLRNDRILRMVLQFWMFFPRLRPRIADIWIVFPENVANKALRDYQTFAHFVPDQSGPNSVTSSVNDETFASRVMFALLFDAINIPEPAVTQALYDLWSTQDDIVPDFPDEPTLTPCNRSGLILFHCRGLQPDHKPLQDCLLRIACVLPLVANLWLSRGPRQSQFMKACGKSAGNFISLFNETFKTLLRENNELQRCSSSSSSFPPSTMAFSFDFSQVVSTAPLLSRQNSEDGTSTNNSVFEADSTVMFLFAAMNVLQEQLVNLKMWDLRSLCQCLVKAKMFDEAHYVMKLIVDRVEVNPKRCLYAFSSKSSLLNASEDAELVGLMADILIGRRDHEALSQLPLTVRASAKSRLLMAEAKKDWVAMTDVASSLGDKQSEARALMYIGGQAADSAASEVRYETYVRRAQWDADAPGFPKRAAESHWKQVYTILKRHHDGLPFGNGNFLAHLLSTLTENTLVSTDVLHRYRQLSLLSALCRSNPAEFLPTVDSSLHAAFSLADLSSSATLYLPILSLYTKLETVIDVVTSEASQLRAVGAPTPALKLLDTLHSVYNNDQLKGLLTSGSMINVNAATICDVKVLVERAVTLRAAGDTDMAIYCAELATVTSGQSFLEIDNKKRRDVAVSKALQLLAELSPTANPVELLRRSVTTLAGCDAVLQSNAHAALARHLESEYYSLQLFTESAAFKLKKEVVTGFEVIEAEVATQHKQKLLSKAAGIETRVSLAELNAERNSIRQVENRKRQGLHGCMAHFLKAITLSQNDETIVYRMVALIIANTEDNELMETVLAKIERIPSFIWLPVLKILCSYLFSDQLPVQRVVDAIAFQTTIQYPFHAVPQLLFYLNDSSKSFKGTQPRNAMLQTLFQRCISANRELEVLLSYMICTHKYFNELGTANYNDSSLFQFCSNKKYQMTNRLGLIKNAAKLCGNVIVPTAVQPIFPPNDHRNLRLSMFVTIKEIHTECTIADGLSSPKVIVITGSDGKRYKMLLKQEDIRQDSLVQQLFALGNILLSQNPFPGAPIIPLRRYIVLPLSAKAGIIEWCEGTTSLCAYLIGNDRKSGAHNRYHPKDLFGGDAQKAMNVVQRDVESKKKLFKEVCGKFNPVFRHFFFERFTSAKSYLTAIERYTISLAQWSIMCYIVGLGDRHLNNILIDESAGEFIHIDLGMIFEYSKRTLPIPENIPFRLTRDVVDPILTDGINGRLRSVAIHTLKVFRENANVIVGIASTLIHDPVSTFAVVAPHSQGQQKPRHLVAESAISRLREKLAGRDFDMREMPAERQVDRLLCDALNVEYLSQIFIGWAPCA